MRHRRRKPRILHAATPDCGAPAAGLILGDIFFLRHGLRLRYFGIRPGLGGAMRPPGPARDEEHRQAQDRERRWTGRWRGRNGAVAGAVIDEVIHHHRKVQRNTPFGERVGVRRIRAPQPPEVRLIRLAQSHLDFSRRPAKIREAMERGWKRRVQGDFDFVFRPRHRLAVPDQRRPLEPYQERVGGVGGVGPGGV